MTRIPEPARLGLHERDAPRPGPISEANFPVEAACCERPVRAGDRIRADGDGGWIHKECEDL